MKATSGTEVFVHGQDKEVTKDILSQAWDGGCRIMYITSEGIRLWDEFPSGIINADFIHLPSSKSEMLALADAWFLD
jgi:hypothetical protein